MSLFRLTTSVIVIALLGGCVVNADEGHPVAIRKWSETGFTVETMWNLHVSVGIDEPTKQKLPRPVDAKIEKLAGMAGTGVLLFRDPNQKSTTFAEKPRENKANDIWLYSPKEKRERQQGAQPLRKTTGMFVDGVRIEFLDHDQMEMKERFAKDASDESDVSLVVVAAGEQFTAEYCEKYAEKHRPNMMIVNSKLTKIGDADVEVIKHNTVAVSKQKSATEKTRFVSMGTEPYKMSDELADLFEKKEKAAKASREVFAKLSVEQLNFKPANGTHTPRWNTEHMMGRELVFFSQIYRAADKMIPVMDINPKQMPKDYEFAHPDWTGAEEALQAERVEAFTRRFAYLLDGMNLDRRAPGSRIWTPRALLKQMQRHYGEHTANVVKKMKLDGWPAE